MDDRKHRNVMFLIADDWSRIAGCYGNEHIHTPRIDELSARGFVFDQAFCTSPSCAVSRACILTGQHSHTHGQYGHCHGIHGFTTHRHMTSTPQALRQHGFATGCIGKKHVEPASVYPFEFEPKVNPRSGPELAEHACAFLGANSHRPFYLHVGFSDPHRAGTGFGNEQPYEAIPDVRYGPDDVTVPSFLPDLPEVRVDLADYYQAVSRFDHGVGCLLDVLHESGRGDDTLVILTTDHGMPFPGAKGSFFDSGHHCPFIICLPGAEGGRRRQSLINWVDIRPTVQEWCGVGVPPGLAGRSLLPVLSEPEPTGWDETYFSHCFHEVVNYNPYRVLRGRRYKYVRNLAAGHSAPLPTDLFRSRSWTAVRERGISDLGERTASHVQQRQPEELYDVIEDPAEADNIIDDPELHTLVRDMRKRLHDFRRATEDPWLELDFQEGKVPSSTPALRW